MVISVKEAKESANGEGFGRNRHRRMGFATHVGLGHLPTVCEAFDLGKEPTMFLKNFAYVCRSDDAVLRFLMAVANALKAGNFHERISSTL